jgi:hypothetical protein
MKTVVLPFLLSLCLVWCGTSCNKEDADETVPTVDYVLINGIDADITVAAGASFSITAGFTDETALNQVRVEIGNEISGTSSFSSVKIYDLAGTNDDASWTVELSDTIASGPHFLEVMAVDQDGNQSDTFALYFEVSKTTQPVINLTAPDFTQVLSYNAGDTVVFAGTVTDETDLEFIKMELLLDGVSQTNVPYDYTDSVITSWDFSQLTTDWWFFIVPIASISGTYDLEVTASDIEGNFTRKSTTLVVN